ncbi:hypothetical protein JYB88_10860 [Shewanella cyperi]|uniref:Uncharacterized protein n=1 Tax=Shewanella cyperi TaxID=2814292 RepID=A0A974XI08_9GAMM|nr:hypothetical protein [Shewanella cyperi]QSX28775.1 hypothetical protein JYB88_10860 [Shewanella cyperi]
MSKVKWKVNNKLILILRCLAFLILAYSCFDVYQDFVRGYIERRGYIYTLQESPLAFYSNVLKRLVIPLMALIGSIFSIEKKDD